MCAQRPERSPPPTSPQPADRPQLFDRKRPHFVAPHCRTALPNLVRESHQPSLRLVKRSQRYCCGDPIPKRCSRISALLKPRTLPRNSTSAVRD
jgi:hypothetical protein